MPDGRPFHLATPQEIKSGEVADVYFNRSVQILRARGNRARVKAEVYLKNLPGDWAGASSPGSRRRLTSWRDGRST